MTDKLKSSRGSALVWALVLCLIMGALGLGLGWLALSMNSRSVRNNVLQQNYFSSRSAVEAFYTVLNGYEQNNAQSKEMYEYLQNNLINGQKNIQVDDVYNGNADTALSAMGTTSLTGTKSLGMVKLTATTAGGDGEATDKTVTLWANRKQQGGEWPSKDWAVELPATQANNQVIIGANSSLQDSSGIDKSKSDVAVYKVSTNRTESNRLCITKDITSEKKAIFIYVESGVQLNLAGMDYVDQNGAYKWFEGHEVEPGITGPSDARWEDWRCYYGPEIFIYLGDGAKLNLLKQNAISGNKDNTADRSIVVPYALYLTGSDTGTLFVTDTNTQIYYSSYENSNLVNTKDEDSITTSGYAKEGNPSASNGVFIDQWEIYKIEGGNE